MKKSVTNQNPQNIEQQAQSEKIKSFVESEKQRYKILNNSPASTTSTQPPLTTDNNFFRAQLTTEDQVLLDRFRKMEQENNSITRTSLPRDTPGDTYLASMKHPEPTPTTKTNTNTDTNTDNSIKQIKLK